MTKEIKFRGWDEENKVMMFRDLSNVSDWIGRKVSIMQYTGLKDKNGKEIYEGDIIKKEGAVFFGTENIPNCCCSSWDVTGWFTKGRYGANPIENECGEIIGNIYENPELLKS